LSELAGARDSTPTPSIRGDGAARVLVVDDEDALRVTLARVLRQRGLVVETAENGYAGLDALERQPFDVVLVDVRMPGLTGPQFLTRVKSAGYTAEVVMMTAFADITTTVSAVKAGAYGFLTKPFVSNEAVVLEILNAAQYKRLREKNERLERELSARSPGGEMVGSCPQMRDVYRVIQGVATTNSTILITGESGTGKELIARAVHERSRRAQKALVTVNCAAIPRDLVESELFGHTRGAFTTAVAARAGLFEAANGGTIFLDEIGDLPTSAQVKLLRTLQSGEVKPVGSDTIKTVDVRVIAATNADLKTAIAAGTFRQDLFYRLNVIRVELPPLRERGDDVLLLAHHFVHKHAQISGRSAARLSSEAAVCIGRYPWPGNVRELEHAIEHAVVFADGDTITPNALPAEVRRAGEGPVSGQPILAADSEAAVSAAGASSDMGTLPYSDAKKRALASFNQTYVTALLRATGGNMSEAARRSGLDRSNFRRLVRTTSAENSRRDSDSGEDL
jgi:two-component system, NtrC family, response regulator HydG